MCGIAGIIYTAEGNEKLDWDALDTAVHELAQAPFGPERSQEFEKRFQRLEELTRVLREFPVLREVYRNSETQATLARSAQVLSEWEGTTQTELLSRESRLTSEQLERWNAVWVRCRDLAWMMEKDALATLARIDAVLPEEHRASDKTLFEAWKLGATLENIGRMEVRGRDSLGISVMVALSPADRDVLEAGLDRTEWARRRSSVDFVNGAVVEDGPVLIFTYKVAQEVGALGDNVRKLNENIRNDAVLWKSLSLPSARSSVFAHTRWASNGIISEPNCHPVNEVTVARNGKPGREIPLPAATHISSCLNGDVDNHLELGARLAAETGQVIPSRVSTDAKIIPVLVDYHLQKTGDLREAFCRAVSECEGSIAVVMQSSREPSKTFLALRGSGQSLFVGLGPHGYVFASELYGVVEHTSHFVRLDGTRERVEGRPETAGQVFVLDAEAIDGLAGIQAYSFDGTPLELGPDDVRTAEITTRDINRGDYEHFLLKEISESPDSIRKTVRGKFFLHEDGEGFRVRMNLGDDVLPEAVMERLKSGDIRRIYWIGQGTAAVAGQAVAAIMESVLGSRLDVRALKATELSGYLMDRSMSDALVIAISQSGTTTDTNRTVDMARSRGAAVLGIVNRRNSDLVYKVEGVLYTSDGRDIEMSVASTKAFYSQVVAGYLLTYQIALELGVVPEEEVYHELREMLRLPDLMRSVLDAKETVRELAQEFAPTRRDWAVVGSGSTRAAADEIRIKLSELCYKSIATDYIEDKKHIDLSSEPLTLVCVAGLGLMALKDAVKEVAIFKSHKSIPLVICSEGFDAFEPYAAGVLYVPKASESASVLLNALVGHLWGYYCALAIDEGAERLRRARAMAVDYLSDSRQTPSLKRVAVLARRFQEGLLRGRYNSSLSVEVATELISLLQYLNGSSSLRQFSEEFQARGTAEGLAATLVTVLSKAIHELSRPIDAIKHQAKTITVGISRLEEPFEGVLFDALRELTLPLDSVPYRDSVTLRAITPAVQQVVGTTCYAVSGLGSLGEPSLKSRVKVVKKTGEAAGMVSRADTGHPLVGTKEWTVRSCALYLGKGRKDDRSIAIIPIAPRGRVERLALLHLEFKRALPLETKVAVLRDMQQRYDDLKSQVMETDLEWQDSFLEGIEVEELVLLPVDKLAERILSSAAKSAVGR